MDEDNKQIGAVWPEDSDGIDWHVRLSPKDVYITDSQDNAQIIGMLAILLQRQKKSKEDSK
jgi:hypothetical protein